MTRTAPHAAASAETLGRCRGCERRVPRHDALLLAASRGAALVCSRCFNETVADLLGLEFSHFAFEPVGLADARGTRHVFHFRSSLLPTGLLLEAYELAGGRTGGRRLAVLGGVRDHPLELFAVLYERLQRALARDPSGESLPGARPIVTARLGAPLLPAGPASRIRPHRPAIPRGSLDPPPAPLDSVERLHGRRATERGS